MSKSSSPSSEPFTSSDSPCVLHEIVSNRFNRTTHGNIYEKDYKDIFAILIINLNLNYNNDSSNTSPESTSRLKFNKSNKYPYSFHLYSAINCMKDLNLTIELVKTVTCISYNFKPEISLSLINQFYNSKFLHSPADRTRDEPKSNVLLQPTPKGIAIVQLFCERYGLQFTNLPEIVLQKSFNSMDLFTFEKDPFTDKILYSEYFLHLLFSKLMGPKPNVWNSSNKPDQLTKVYNFQKLNNLEDQLINDTFSLTSTNKTIVQNNNSLSFNFSEYRNSTDLSNPPDISKLSLVNKNESDISPYHHRYFTNPESDSHIQYYTSSVGVRLLKNKTFQVEDDKFRTVDYCMSGKAICQWLLDCTDIINAKRTTEICEVLLKMNLFKSINKSNTAFKKDQYYELTKVGLKICSWGKSSETTKTKFLSPDSNYQISKLTLNEIVHDPGLRFQFKRYLEENFCSENLDAYISLTQFEKKFELWESLFKQQQQQDEKVIDEQKLITLQNICMSNAYQIFNTFLNNESPFMVNIDHKLRIKIIKIMTNHKNFEPSQDLEIDNSIFLRTPTDDIIVEEEENIIENKLDYKSNHVLKEVAEIFLQICNHLYRLMDADSVPKFLSKFR
ncbi:unnamed protein product [Candida verbasci]|uniref:Regulator of G protein signaling superfamily n=1 Tax=Candida verbasci TaxID=1227364 RepID=A0A9W4XBV0_9ASCO|nr:unnamed protein product [Candida verbasci]